MAKGKGDDGGGWLASLARQSAAADVRSKPKSTSKRKRKGGGLSAEDSGVATATAAAQSTLTKAQRIERRERKRAEREERKRLSEEKRQERIAKKRQRDTKHGARSAMGKSSGEARAHDGQSRSAGGTKRRGMSSASKKALARLSTALDSANSRPPSTAVQPKGDKKRQREDVSSCAQDGLVNGLPAEPLGKATKRGTLRPDSKELQPRIRDYNGQGLVQPSLYLPLDDPSFRPKVELEFAEHVEGFFGKAKQKAAKRQADANMLWRRRLRAKEEEEEGEGGSGKKKRKKKEDVVESLGDW